MFPQQPQQQFKKAGADIQIFYGSSAVSAATSQRTWNKPAGVSHIYMMLIGAGGDGGGATLPGGSGAVTVWYGAAQNVPDSLLVAPCHAGSLATTVSARFSNSSAAGTTLLTANAGNGINAGNATSANAFAASGFYQSVAGQAGIDAPQDPSATTFLSGGSGTNAVRANYGWTNDANNQGMFAIGPIIVGAGGTNAGKGGVGCGGGGTGKGGQGMVLIASW